MVFTGQDISIFEQKQGLPLSMFVDGRVPRTYTLQEDKLDPASRMLAIGGIHAKVTPKRRGKLDLEEDREFAQDPERIGFRGKLTPDRANQPVEVTLRDPKGRERHQTAMTNASGDFTAVFDLTLAPDDGGREPPEKEEPMKGDYEAQAFIVNAPSIAETQSNVVSITK